MMNVFFRRLFGLFALSICAASVVDSQTPKADRLKRYTTCKASAGLRIKDIARRSDENQFREVVTDLGKQKVSVVDGYRVMFAYPDVPYYFANVKIEQSSTDKYTEDKEILINQLKHFTNTKEATAMIFMDRQVLNGFEHYGLDRDRIDVGGQVGTHVLFYDPLQLVVTINFLNQSKAVFANNRRFETIKQYEELRDQFLQDYSECLRRVAGGGP